MNKTHAERLEKFRAKNRAAKVLISLDEIKMISAQIDFKLYGYKKIINIKS
jgi:hypothetical protein